MHTPKIVRNFLVLEGLDGAGTTTQGRLFYERCVQEGMPARLTQEPTTDPVGLLIRSILQGKNSVVPSTMARLFAADRNEHVFGPNGILASAKLGEIVLSDRYLFSSLAYQTVDCDPRLIRDINASFPLPEILFFLDIPPEVGEKRLGSRADREIYEFREFQHRVAKNYLDILEEYTGSAMRILKVDGTREAGDIHEELWSFFKKFRY